MTTTARQLAEALHSHTGETADTTITHIDELETLVRNYAADIDADPAALSEQDAQTITEVISQYEAAE